MVDYPERESRSWFGAMWPALVIALMVIVAALTIDFVAPYALTPRATKASIAAAEVTSLAAQLAKWSNAPSSYPGNFSLNALVSGPNPPLKPSQIIDPWGRPYVVIGGYGEFQVASVGPDGVFTYGSAGGDDVYSGWTLTGSSP